MTVKAFLKNEEKKREKERTEAKISTPAPDLPDVSLSGADIAIPTTEKREDVTSVAAPAETPVAEETKDDSQVGPLMKNQIGGKLTLLSQALDRATNSQQPEVIGAVDSQATEAALKSEGPADQEKLEEAQKASLGDGQTQQGPQGSEKPTSVHPSHSSGLNYNAMTNGFGNNNNWIGAGMYNPMMAMNGMNGNWAPNMMGQFRRDDVFFKY